MAAATRPGYNRRTANSACAPITSRRPHHAEGWNVLHLRGVARARAPAVAPSRRRLADRSYRERAAVHCHWHSRFPQYPFGRCGRCHRCLAGLPERHLEDLRPASQRRWCRAVDGGWHGSLRRRQHTAVTLHRLGWRVRGHRCVARRSRRHLEDLRPASGFRWSSAVDGQRQEPVHCHWRSVGPQDRF